MDTFSGWQDVPISLNKFLYAHSDPVNGRDASGKSLSAETLATAAIKTTLVSIGVIWGWTSAMKDYYQSNIVVFELTFYQKLWIAGPRAGLYGVIGWIGGKGGIYVARAVIGFFMSRGSSLPPPPPTQATEFVSEAEALWEGTLGYVGKVL